MRKAVLATSFAVIVAALIAVGSAVAATGGTGHTVTQTENFHGVQTTTDTNPCTGNAIDLTQTSNIVQHVTFFPAGDEMWGTFTEEDKVTGVDEGTGVVYTGHSTFWGNFNVNERNANDTSTGSIHVTGSDGSTISYHEVMHETLNANGVLAVSFDRPSLTCG
jgi:hypothetical protein